MDEHRTGLVHAEDVVPGTTYDLGAHTLTLEEVVQFSRQWDPQDFHVDGSSAGYFGGTIASGLHSMAILQRLSVLGVYRHWAVVAGRRIRDVSFLAPARPGMTLRGSLVVDSVADRDGTRSLVTTSKTLSAGSTVVLTSVHELYVFRRTAGADREF
jgi:acyl dehydratase